MKKIKSIVLRRLRNAAHFQMHTEFKKLVEASTPEALKIEALFAKYLLLYEKLDDAYKKIVKSAITEQIQEADKARDEIWKGLAESNATALRHFDPQVRESARHLQIVFKTYGNLARKSLNEQTSATDNFVQDFEGPYAAHVAKVGLLPWLVELKARNIAFANLVRDRAREASLKNLAAFKKVRAALDEVYYEIIEFINALAIVEGSAVCKSFITELNVYVTKYLLLIAQSSKKGKKSEAAAGDTDNTQTNGGSDE